MRINITDLEGGLTYRGKVAAVRQTYYVFEGTSYYFVASFSRTKPGAGNFNVVSKKGVEYVQKAFAGKHGITSSAVVARARQTLHARTTLIALNILYVLVALGAGKIEKRGEHSKLFFRVLRASKASRN
jgi:hypothetical protein